MDKPLSAHLKAFILPFVMLVVLPAGLNLLEFHLAGRPLVTRQLALLLVGGLVGLGGGVLLAASIRLIIVYANTTVMPWVPSERLVVRGPYRHVRNPMILGVVLVMTAEGLILESFAILGLALIFFAGNTVYFILREEPELAERFGEDYDRYCANVRRWWPRLRPWVQGRRKNEK
ncbi:isoprenylcysteine carboxylmethyltransferase family protein [bacterium]|nr:isoprenylcysteine carboxylmethyltransferase family protein [bacterium]